MKNLKAVVLNLKRVENRIHAYAFAKARLDTVKIEWEKFDMGGPVNALFKTLNIFSKNFGYPGFAEVKEGSFQSDKFKLAYKKWYYPTWNSFLDKLLKLGPKSGLGYLNVLSKLTKSAWEGVHEIYDFAGQINAEAGQNVAKHTRRLIYVKASSDIVVSTISAFSGGLPVLGINMAYTIAKTIAEAETAKVVYIKTRDELGKNILTEGLQNTPENLFVNKVRLQEYENAIKSVEKASKKLIKALPTSSNAYKKTSSDFLNKRLYRNHNHHLLRKSIKHSSTLAKGVRVIGKGISLYFLAKDIKDALKEAKNNLKKTR